MAVSRDGGTRDQHIAGGVLGAALVALGLYTLWSFLSALVWAGIFAIALWPVFCRARTHASPRLRGTLLPGVFTLAVALIFIVPLGLVGFQLAHEAHDFADWVRSVQQNGLPEPQFMHHLPFGQSPVDSCWQQNLADPGSARDWVERSTHGRMGELSRQLGHQVAHRLTLFAFTLLTLFFLFKDGDTVTRQVRRAANRAFGPRGERVGRQIIASIHGTVNGLVLVGLGEGFLLGVVYAFAGVPHPTVFGALTAVAAMVPFAAPIVFGIAALILLAQGSMVWAALVVLTGFAVTFIADHFVRPVLIGGATRLPFIWVLLGILGGVEAFGLLGLFIGPATMAALILLWREWAGEHPDDAMPDPAPP